MSPVPGHSLHSTHRSLLMTWTPQTFSCVGSFPQTTFKCNFKNVELTTTNMLSHALSVCYPFHIFQNVLSDTCVYTVPVKSIKDSPDRCGSVGGMSSHKAKAHWVEFQSEHMPELRVLSPFGAYARGNQSTFLSHINVSLPLFLPPFPSL